MAGRRSRTSVEVVPLLQRVWLTQAFCGVLAMALLVLGELGGKPATPAVWFWTVVYLAVTTLLSLGTVVGSQKTAVRMYGLALTLDGLYLQAQHARIGHQVATDVALAAFLVVGCLLASYRTGLKMALWQSILVLFEMNLRVQGLGAVLTGMRPVPLSGQPVVLAHDTAYGDVLMLWIVVLVTATAGAVNERELRRRRYDAETLARFASALHGDRRPDGVARSTVEFLTGELGVRRAALVRRVNGELEAVALSDAGQTERSTPRRLRRSHGRSSTLETAATDRQSSDRPSIPRQRTAPGPGRSALLDLVDPDGGEATLVLRLSPVTDPWLAMLLPSAERVLSIPVDASTQLYLVAELGPGSKGRAERRIIAAVEQACATTGLAWMRALLLQQAERAASTDGLTGVANRRTFDATLTEYVDLWQTQGQPLAMFIMDVDRFKSVNDRFGHPVGDEVLRVVARVLSTVARPSDLAARYGGEEFCLLMPGTDLATATDLAEQVRRALHDVVEPVPVTASFGVAAMPQDADTATLLLQTADNALLEAKNRGRDRVMTPQMLRVG